MTASKKLSVRSCRNMRTRPAPRAARTASSRSRRTMRERFRFATFAHAISSTTLPERARGRWHVHVIFVRVLWYWRQHTDYRVNPVVHRERLVHDCRVAAETLDPILVAEHQHGRRPWLLIFWTESTPKKRLDSKNIEVIPGNHSRFHPLRLAAAQQDEIHVVVFNQAVQRAALPAVIVCV